MVSQGLPRADPARFLSGLIMHLVFLYLPVLALVRSVFLCPRTPWAHYT